MKRFVLSMCDLTGVMVKPWVDHGYRAILIDPQHVTTSDCDGVLKLAMTVDEAMPFLSDFMRHNVVSFVAAFPPCTDMAVSGARWFARKYAADHLFQARAVAVAEQCRTIARLSGAPYLIENPVSVLSSVFGKADFTFNPCDFTALEPSENYVKKTCLWTGGGFRMPPPQREARLGPPDQRIFFAPPSIERSNFRSRTPLGFARAVFSANGGALDEFNN